MVALIILLMLPRLVFGLLGFSSLAASREDVSTLADGTQAQVRR
jgi:hypothetical protein